MKMLILMVHGGNANFRKDDGILKREISRNTFFLDRGNPSFGEVLDRYLDMSRFSVEAPLFPNAADIYFSQIIKN